MSQHPRAQPGHVPAAASLPGWPHSCSCSSRQGPRHPGASCTHTSNLHAAPCRRGWPRAPGICLVAIAEGKQPPWVQAEPSLSPSKLACAQGWQACPPLAPRPRLHAQNRQGWDSAHRLHQHCHGLGGFAWQEARHTVAEASPGGCNHLKPPPSPLRGHGEAWGGQLGAHTQAGRVPRLLG